ncbi:Hypothetical protein I595_330 [Croceitalea dokdonensis DOKDO 023]|uniref:Uncharacterized protein n=1 Tax=Croceitalea dokdonensis DOKDO 023 TaxID=1300341 RepID=A0A0P7AYV9_9FLAO|nr:Hypothetical protein I595_330 [Croceitalea dokdonensis DOKDO 023]
MGAFLSSILRRNAYPNHNVEPVIHGKKAHGINNLTKTEVTT